MRALCLAVLASCGQYSVAPPALVSLEDAACAKAEACGLGLDYDKCIYCVARWRELNAAALPAETEMRAILADATCDALKIGASLSGVAACATADFSFVIDFTE